MRAGRTAIGRARVVAGLEKDCHISAGPARRRRNVSGRDTSVGHPQLQAWKYPLPGDEDVTTIQRVIIEVDTPRVIRLKMPPDQHRSTLCDDVQCRGGEWADVEWTPDATQLAFVSTSRDHKHAQLRIADAATGEIRDVLEETAATQL